MHKTKGPMLTGPVVVHWTHAANVFEQRLALDTSIFISRLTDYYETSAMVSKNQWLKGSNISLTSLINPSIFFRTLGSLRSCLRFCAFTNFKAYIHVTILKSKALNSFKEPKFLLFYLLLRFQHDALTQQFHFQYPIISNVDSATF